jgi:hypothetical protein
MLSLGELARSLSAYGAQTAANAASFSKPLPPVTVAAPAVVDAVAETATDNVSISAEAYRQLQEARANEKAQAANRLAAAADADLAARMAYAVAYRREVVVVPAVAYSNLPTSLYAGASSPSSNAASLAKVQAEVDQARLARIAVYEMELAKGTPPAQIYSHLLALTPALPPGYRVSIA